ncbi:hypothetical protein H8959_001185, partial [Pygathrix nigripes]
TFKQYSQNDFNFTSSSRIKSKSSLIVPDINAAVPSSPAPSGSEPESRLLSFQNSDNNRDAENNNYDQHREGAPLAGQRSAPPLRSTRRPRQPLPAASGPQDLQSRPGAPPSASHRRLGPPRPAPEPPGRLSRPLRAPEPPRPAPEPPVGPSPPRRAPGHPGPPGAPVRPSRPPRAAGPLSRPPRPPRPAPEPPIGPSRPPRAPKDPRPPRTWTRRTAPVPIIGPSGRPRAPKDPRPPDSGPQACPKARGAAPPPGKACRPQSRANAPCPPRPPPPGQRRLSPGSEGCATPRRLSGGARALPMQPAAALPGPRGPSGKAAAARARARQTCEGRREASPPLGRAHG